MSRRSTPPRAIALGVALGLVFTCAVLFALERVRRADEEVAALARPVPLTSSGTVVADDAGPLREILMHYVPELEPMFAPAYRDFLASLSKETRLVFVIRRGTRPRLDAFLAGIEGIGSLGHRSRVIEIDTPLGIWSKDRALVLSPDGGSGETKTQLVVPPRPRSGEGSRPADWDIVPAVARAMPEAFDLRELPIAFDGGDFAVSGKRVLFDVNLFARNRSRGFRSPQELRDRMRTLIGRDVVMLGAEVGDVPRHHMSMYMALVDGHTALVGDPEAGARLVGRDYVPGERSSESGQPLRADFSALMTERFARAATDLAAAGYRVVRIPTVPFDDRTYFAYTNGVYETRDGERIARIPSFGVPAIDTAARAVYESLGWRVVPISVRDLYASHGTIGCLVNVLDRRP